MATRATTATVNTTAIEPNGWLAAVLRRAALVVPGLVLGWFAAIHFADGRAVDAAVPVPVYMVARVNMPKAAYTEAAAVLQQANPRNGTAVLARGEALMRAGESPAHVIPILVAGLHDSPSSARGWTLLAENVAVTQKGRAAQILAQALVLAPRDYWLAGLRANDAALLWPELDVDGRALALFQTRLLWHEEQLRPQLLSLADFGQGAALISRALPPDEIRAVNRWLAQQRSMQP